MLQALLKFRVKNRHSNRKDGLFMGRKVTKFLSNLVVSVLSLVILNESINNAVDAIGSKKDAE